MATKAQIARRKYGCSLSELTVGQKSTVTRLFNAQQTQAPAEEFADDSYDEAEDETPAPAAGMVRCEFGRPNYNGTKPVIVTVGTTMEQALVQSGLGINKTKEGVVDKSNGAVVRYIDPVVDGKTYVILPGIDSSAQ